MTLLQKFEQNWEHQKFPQKGSKVLVATSGGKDSMVLCQLLIEIGHLVTIAHCNFQLREDEADLDELLVRDYGKEKNLLVHCIRFDTKAEMIRRNLNVQETARNLRYEWFRQLCATHHYTCVCTAHHANDNAETLLINLCKGTGISGLHGIPKRNQQIIRPLLFATRAEIDSYVIAENVPYRDDESNKSMKYLRNKVRHKLIPMMEEIFPNVVFQLNQTIERIKQTEIIYNNAIAQEIKNLTEQRGFDKYIPILKLQKRPAFEAICFEIFTSFGFTAAQIPQIIQLFKSESGKYIASASHRVIKDRQFLIISSIESSATEYFLIEKIPEIVKTNEGEFRFKIGKESSEINPNKNIAQIDAKAIQFPLKLRRKKTADYFYPIGMGMKKKKLSKFFIDQKTPLQEKEKAWIVESGQKIVWLAGLRMDERFKIGSSTAQIVEIEFLSNV